MGQITGGLGLAAIALIALLPEAAQCGTLRNQDIVTLAGAGFSENFILETIAGSPTQFDTNATALAELAKRAISERIIRFMMNRNAAADAVIRPAETVPLIMPSPNGPVASKLGKVSHKQPSATVLAIESGTPVYEWKSFFFGLWQKRVGVAPSPGAHGATVQHLGTVYQETRPPQPPYVRTNSYEPLTYYTVAPR